MQPAFFDNRTSILKDDLVREMREGSVVSVASSVFSMYAYRELREQLDEVDAFRFIFTSPTFLADRAKKEQREFYIPRLDRERGVGGTDLEIRLKNEMTSKAIAVECAEWARKKATFKSFRGAAALPPVLTLDTGEDACAYLPMNGFTTVELGCSAQASSYNVICRQDSTTSRSLLATFEAAWGSDDLDDVTGAVIESIAQMYRENPPELVYYAALHRIFREFLDDITVDELPKEGARFRESRIWNLLYDFQRDAVLAIINKLQTYDGCILADSVGLGKTFTALAVIKYYESLNRNVLVLCPKKLGDNWLTYRNNQRNNPIAQDRLRYDVLYHTDLSRKRGTSATGLDLETINWGAYDLVVIDESHNFRNGQDGSREAKDGEEPKENRYARLLNRVVREYKDYRVFSDIGCYTLGALPPFRAIHSCVDMGASITMAKGAADAGLVIGDSTFTHSGITGLLDAVNSNANITVVISDNLTTAMTGGQDSAGTNKLEAICLGVGVDPAHVRVVVPLPKNMDEITAILREEIEYRGVSVIIPRRECIQTLKRHHKEARQNKTTKS